jgi:RNA 2',3'-cyclic 3'-phosphodiesterase
VRLFLAIELPDEARRHLVKVQEVLKAAAPEAAYTRGQNLHLTLKFLGEVDERRVPEICESLVKIAVSGRLELSADRIECFPPRGPVRIVAAAMCGSEAAMGGLHAAIEQRCKFLGFTSEARKYKPHVTLARARKPLRGDVRMKLREESTRLWPGPEFTVTEFVLMDSRLRAEGSEYSVAARFPIG